MTERWDARRLLTRRFRTRPTAAILVAALALLTVVVAAVVPRLVEQQATAELAYQLQSIGTVARSLQGSAGFPEPWPAQPAPDLSQLYDGLSGNFEHTREQYDEPLRGMVGAPRWIVQTPTIRGAEVGGGLPIVGVRLTADPTFLKKVRIVRGVAPATWNATDSQAPEETRQFPVDVAVSVAAAEKLNLSPGDVIGANVVRGAPDRLYRVSGLFEPIDARSDFWSENPSLLPVTPMLTERDVEYPTVSVFVDPLTVGRLAQTFAAARVSVYFPITADGAEGADAAVLHSELAAAVSTGASLPNSDNPMPLVTRSDQAVETAVERDALLTGLLAMLAAAPLGLVLAVLVLGAQVLTRARRSELILAAARGGSGWQLRGALALEGALLTVPAAIVVTAVATILIPVRADAAGFVLPALVAATPPLLFAALAETRADPGLLRQVLGQLRGVIEVGVILFAGLSLFLLARRGLAQAAETVGVDPLLSVAPLLLAVSVGVVVLRGYPLPMRAARRVATRARGLAAFVGAVRATRSPTIGLAGVLALVVGLSVSLFSAVLLTTFDAGISRAAAESVGADARVDAPVITPAQRAAVTKVDGVRAVAGIQYLASATLADPTFDDTVTALLADTTSLATMRALPADLTIEVGGRIPVIVSSDLRAELGRSRTATIDDVKVRVVGSLPAASHLGPDDHWVMMDSSFAPKFHTTFAPGVLLIAAEPDRLPQLLHPLQRAVGANPDDVNASVTATTVAQATAVRNEEPAVAGIRLGSVLAASLSVLLCVLALVLATVAAAAARGRTAGILRTLGMPRRRLATLIAWELVPVGVVALVAGGALGVALPYIVTSAVDLRPFTGGLARPALVLDPLLLGGVLTAFTLVVLAAGLIAVAVGNRVNPSATLKMGAS
ncbi:MAG TPA: ABC transporter permease [Pseudolysinimonas sp.]